jgi:hypothetical protein
MFFALLSRQHRLCLDPGKSVGTAKSGLANVLVATGETTPEPEFRKNPSRMETIAAKSHLREQEKRRDAVVTRYS